MKRNRVIVGIAMFAIVLAACSPSAPAATPTTALLRGNPTLASAATSAATSAAPVPTVPVATISIDDPNAVKTASGLKYVDIVPGTGATPTSTDWVTVQFTATLQNGTIIGATRPRGAPAQIPLDQLAKEVPGWAEGMSTMKVGGTRKLIIPPNLAYGDKGAGNGIIPPNATLIFMVDMLDTRPAPQVKIEDTKVGTGAEAKTGSTISVMYTGTLTNGQVFDSSYQRNEPFTLTLGAGQVIPGWEQGLQGMKVGGERTLTIPPELGYGAQGAGNAIPPNATLIFQVQLLDVK